MSAMECCKIWMFPCGPVPPENFERRHEIENSAAMIILDYSLGVTFLVNGVINVNNCPLEKLIPILFIVGGCFMMTYGTLKIIVIKCGPSDRALLQRLMHYIFYGLSVLWIAFGSWLVYKEFEPNYDPELGEHCKNFFYYYAFFVMTTFNIMLAIILILFCVLLIAIASGWKSNV